MRLKKILPVVAGALLLASPALANSRQASCGKIRAALDAGKTQQQVAKDMKTSVDHVKHCTMQSNASSK